MKYTPHPYQATAFEWLLRHDRCCLFLDMGLGKTVVTLTAIRQLIDDCAIDNAIVVAPKKVAESTWTDEAQKWDHLAGLSVVPVLGTPKQRVKALDTEADVHIIGRDSWVWLCDHYKGRLPYDMIIIDELTSFKTPSSKRSKAMRKASATVRRVVGLTGTPAPNGLIDLWSEMFCVDLGERLGQSFTRYRETYFNTYIWNNIPVRCTPKRGAEAAIRGKLSDICLSMQARDYLTLPPLIMHTQRVALSWDARCLYTQLERDLIVKFEDEHGNEDGAVLAMSAAGLMSKLSQISNGAVYEDDGTVRHIHDDKLDALAEIVEQATSGVLCYYLYRHDIPRILERCKHMKKRAEVYEGSDTLRRWNAGEIDVLLAHPASTAYGLNMQQGGNYVVWFGTGWNLELYLQANARLHRQGQAKPVHVYRLVCRDTVDERMVAALDAKKNVQQALMDSLDALRRRHRVGGQNFAASASKPHGGTETRTDGKFGETKNAIF